MPRAEPKPASEPYETEDHIFYLWHLVKMGILNEPKQADPGKCEDSEKSDDFGKAELWDRAQKVKVEDRVLVAIIDTGVDIEHPNLKDAIEKPQADFTPHFQGVIYKPPVPACEELQRELAQENPNPAKLRKVARVLETELKSWGRHLGFDHEKVAQLVAELETIANGSGKEKSAQMPGGTVESKANEILDVLAQDPTDQNPPQSGVGRGQKPDRIAVVLDPLIAESKRSIAALEEADLDAAKLEAERARLIRLTSLKKYSMTLRGNRKVIRLRDPSRFFGAHGTACAGLIGGRPELGEEKGGEPPETQVASGAEPRPRHKGPGSIPYFGVNPYCKILPIATPYSHEFLPLIHALLHAFMSGAKVIHIPRGMPDYRRRGEAMACSHFKTRIEASNNETKVYEDQADYDRLIGDQRVFEELLNIVSQQCYVVLAAGNDSWEEDLSYPARLYSKCDHMVGNKLVVVGAKNRRGCISSYSNGANADPPILHMFSDDAFALNQRQVAYDERSRGATDYDYTPHIPPGAVNTFSPWGLFTLDVRGSYGYAAGLRYDPPEYDAGLERGALYTVFGGTSGASALVAGLISLLLQVGDLDSAGVEGMEALGEKFNRLASS